MSIMELGLGCGLRMRMSVPQLTRCGCLRLLSESSALNPDPDPRRSTTCDPGGRTPSA